MIDSDTSTFNTGSALSFPWARAVHHDTHDEWNRVIQRLMGMASLCIWHGMDDVESDIAMLLEVAQMHRRNAPFSD